MSGRGVRRITLWLILGLVVLSCGTPALVTPPPQIIHPEAVETVIVQTAGAAQTQTMVSLPPTSTPSLTQLATHTATISPTPTATFLFLAPTNTNLPEGFLADDADGNGTGGDDDGAEPVKTPRPKLWACQVLSKYPPNDAVIYGGTSLKTVWTVRNTGTQTWPKKSVDIVYVGGLKLVDGRPIFDIPSAVGPGGTISISVTMDIPKLKGEYQTRWGFRIGKTTFCTVRFRFEVK